ncbi:MAG TPA: alpha/beta hydrolase [Cerasibacillus sp.]|uniref:alpha/beta fold hydrolase n=1 Tax=Cerasibacillus sp. TaxID=2498711 RepID=UPI002F41EDC0
MPVIQVNGIKLFYQEAGDKANPPLLLLHGLTSHHQRFKREVNVFKKDYHVIVVDARGHGNSDRPDEYTLEDHISDIIGLMDALELEKVHLLGVSMGSYIAQGVAIKQPHRVGKMILIGAKAHGQTSSMSQLFSEHAEELQGMSFEQQMNRLAKYMFYDLRAVGRWLHDTENRELTLSAKEQQVARKALTGFDFRPNLSEVKAETLVISGTYDGLNPPKDGREISELIPRATLMVFTKSGHAPHVEEPEKFIQVVSEFLRE